MVLIFNQLKHKLLFYRCKLENKISSPLSYRFSEKRARAEMHSTLCNVSLSLVILSTSAMYFGVN